MKHKEEYITEEKVINTPAGGVLIGKDKDGQTIIPNDGSLGGFLIGRLHKDGGIKAINKGTGQPLEMQSNEIIITAPAVSDQTKREFEGKMMTNREILSKINSDGGGVSFADGGDIPAKIHTTDCEYKFGGKVVKDTDIAHSLGMNSTLKKGKQQFSSGDTTYDVDAIYNAIKKGKLRLKTKEVETFPMKYPVYDKHYAENHKIDFRKPNGITVLTESGEEVLIDGNHRMNNAYLKGRKTMKTYYIEDPKEIKRFVKNNRVFSDEYQNKMATATAKKDIRTHFNHRGDAFDDRKDSENWSKYSLPYDTRFDIEFKNGGHLSSGKSLKQIAEMHNVSLAHINEQLAKGLEVEKEHFADFKERTRVAKDHLVENPNYYTILEKAGLKDGGHLIYHRHSNNLVKDAKSGNTPARDLNNYNDVLDLEADGMVGADSGLAFANGGKIDDWFEKPHNLRSVYNKDPFEVTVNDFDCAEKIKNKHKQVEIIKLVNPRVKIPVTYVLVIKNWSSVEELKEMLIECVGNTVSYGFTSNEQIEAYKRMSFADGGNVNFWEKEDVTIVNGDYGKLAEVVPSYKDDTMRGRYFVVFRNLKGKIVSFEDNFETYSLALEYAKENVNNDEKYANGGLTPYDANSVGDSVPVLEDEFAKGGAIAIDPEKLQQANALLSNLGMKPINKFGENEDEVGMVYITRTNEPYQTIITPDGVTVEILVLNPNPTIRKSQLVQQTFIKNWNGKDWFMSTLKDKKGINTNVYSGKMLNYVEFKLDESTPEYLLFSDTLNVTEASFRNQIVVANAKIKEIIKNGLNLKNESITVNYNSLLGVTSNPNKTTANTAPTVDKITIKETKFDGDSNIYSGLRENIVGKEATNISYFINLIKDYVGQNPLEETDWLTFYVNDGKRGNYYIDLNKDKKNTVKNVNPKTGGGNDIKRVIDANKYLSKNYDWTEFFGGQKQTPISTLANNIGQGTTSTKTPLIKEELNRVKIWIGDDINLKEKVIQKLEEIGFLFDRNNGNPDADKNISIYTFTIDFVVFKENKEQFNVDQRNKEIFPEDLGIDVTTMGVAPTTSSTQSQYPEYYEYVEKSSSSFSKGKIYKIKNPKNLTEAGNFVDDTGVYNGHGYLNAQYFKPSTEEAFLAQQTPVSNTTTDNEVTYISLNYEVNGTPTYYSALTTGKDFIEAINSIEQSNPIQDVSVNIIVGYNDSKNFTQELRENFNFGKGAFRPSNWSVSEIKSIVANDWFDGKLDFDKFFSDIVSTVLASKTPTSTSAYKTDKEVQSVLIKYGNGSEYTALNEESLLSMLKDIWDSNGKTLRTVNIQPQGRVSSLSVFKIVDLIENPVNIEYEINPDKITLDELRDKLSKDKNWYDDLDWSDFFKNQSQTSDKEVNRIKLVYDTGTLRTFICNNGSELFDTFKLIEEQAQGGSLGVKVTLSGNYNNGKFFETQGITQEIGKGGLEPSQIYSFEEFEKIIKGMFTAFNFNNFFKESKTPASASAKPFDFTDTKIDVMNNLELSLKVQKRAFENGWEWEKGGGKNSKYGIFNYLYFTKKSISNGFESSSFNNSPKREITEAEIFGSQTPTWDKEKVESVVITEQDYSGKELYTAYDEISLLNKLTEIWDKSNLNNDLTVGLQTKKDSVNLYPSRLLHLSDENLTKGYLNPKEISLSAFKEKLSVDWFPKLDWSDFFKESKTPASTSAKPFDFSDTKIWIGDNPELSRRVQEKAFESGWEWNDEGKQVLFTDAKLLYFWNNKTIGFIVDATKKDFDGLLFREITEQDIFGNQQTPTLTPVVPKTVGTIVSDLDEAVQKLEKASSKVATEYNTEVYDKSLKFLYDTKATYELALKFTPESAFMYERLEIMKKLADLEKNIKRIEDMKKGGAFYILAKILEKLQRGENWRTSENAQDVITNQLPQSEIDVIIRSHKFKNWFGNWEKALVNDEYDNVSKALTDGIPSVYHHGARRIKYTYREVSNGVLYLAENISYALWFSQNSTAQSEEGNYLTDCFVNIKNPIDLTAFHVNQIDLADLVRYVDAIYPLARIYDFIPAQVALLIKTNQPTNIRMWAWQLIRKYAKFVNHIKENTPYDGFLYYENNPSDQVINPVTGQSEENVTKAVAIFKSHQVKVVDAVLFDGGLDDWRFENGGKINN